MEIFERHGQWREAEAQRLIETASRRLPRTLFAAGKHLIEERTKYNLGEEMVQYWGFSYGTILGATLSAMYPKRIKRALLDGVANSHDYMAGGRSLSSGSIQAGLTIARLDH